MSHTQKRIAGGILAGGVALFYLGLNSGTWLISPDSTDYVEGARSLAALVGYVDAAGVPLTFFPPGTSMLYAVAALLPAADYVYFNLLTKLLVVTFVGLSFAVVRRSAGTAPALLVVLFLVLSQTLTSESTQILSDLAFGAALMLTVFLFPENRIHNLSPRAALGLGLMAAACYAFRTVGMSVFLAYVAAIALRAQHRRVRTIGLVSLVFMAVVVPLALRAAPGEHSYFRMMFWREQWVSDSGIADLSDWWTHASVNLRQTLFDIHFVLTNDWDVGLSGVATGGLMVLGVVTAILNGRVLYVSLLFFYVLALVVMGSVPRYILPVIALLAMVAIDGGRWAMNWPQARWASRGLLLGLLAVVCVSPYWWNGYLHARALRAELNRFQGAAVAYPGHGEFLDLVRRHSHELTPADVVATMHPNVLRYFLPDDVTLWVMPSTVDPEKAYQAIIDRSVTYLYCDKTVTTIWSRIAPMIERHASGLTLVAENASAVIYRVAAEPD
ncbi:MAG TPA: hypothetical protein PKW63_07100 [Vicinamibacterales bacterium]|nr:hypothetical protein [Vicinamibacterales bacterium]